MVEACRADQELDGINFLKDCELAMHGERADAITEIESLRRHRDCQEFKEQWGIGEEFGLIPDHDPVTVDPIIIYLMPSGWCYQNELAVSQCHQKRLLCLVDSRRQLAMPQIKNGPDTYHANWPMPWNIFAIKILPFLSHSAEKLAYTQNYVNMARVACELERCRIAYNKYPDMIDALVTSEFIKTLPHDIIGGQPLHYHLTKDGSFVLYSIGWNETDDGGQLGFSDTGRLDTDKGDWVWPSKPSN